MHVQGRAKPLEGKNKEGPMDTRKACMKISTGEQAYTGTREQTQRTEASVTNAGLDRTPAQKAKAVNNGVPAIMKWAG